MLLTDTQTARKTYKQTNQSYQNITSCAKQVNSGVINNITFLQGLMYCLSLGLLHHTCLSGKLSFICLVFAKLLT